MSTIGVSNWIMSKAPPAISGSGGHSTTYNVACSLWRMLGDEVAVWQGLVEYNAAKCSPQWSERELRHKLVEAEKATRGERTTQPKREKYGKRHKSRAFQPPRELPNLTLNFAPLSAQIAIPPAPANRRITGVYTANQVRALQGEVISIQVWQQDPSRYLVTWQQANNRLKE